MKKLLLMLFFIPFISLAQEYSEVIEMTGQTGDQLYSKANEWFALTFKSAKDVIQLNDPTEKKIIGKGSKRISYTIGRYPISLDMNFTLLVQFKDGKYKYNIQSNEINPIIGTEKYTYELLKQRSTVEGVTEHLKIVGPAPWVIGKKQIELIAEGNKNASIEAENQLHNIITDLTMALNKKDTTDNW